MGLNLKAFVQRKKPMPKWKGNLLNGEKKILANNCTLSIWWYDFTWEQRYIKIDDLEVPKVFNHQTQRTSILSIFHFDTFVLIKITVYCVTNMVERMTNLQMETWLSIPNS